MQTEKFLNLLKENGIAFLTNEVMKNHTTFKIGGKADFYILPETEEQLVNTVNFAKETRVPYFIIGNGSNLLVKDNGIEGAVIDTTKLNKIIVSGETVECGAGAKLSRVCLICKDNSLSGLEFAYGIPGSIGGAFFMNAGAYGGEINDVCLSAKCLNNSGEVIVLNKEDMCLSYRSSRFKAENLIIISVKLTLKQGNKEEIFANMNDYLKRRTDKQPLDYPSAGSTFKRPVGYYAGALIEGAGLKGFSVGGAQVSEKHAGFVINKNNATALDVITLMSEVTKRIKEKDGVTLEPEVIIVGRD